MGWLAGLVGSSAAQPIEAVGGVLDKLFTSDDERLAKKELFLRLAQRPAELQVELNKIEAQHRSIFVAGWRPFIGWVCGVGLAFPYVINPVVQWLTGDVGPVLPIDSLIELVIALLGMGTLRTLEKFGGKTK